MINHRTQNNLTLGDDNLSSNRADWRHSLDSKTSQLVQRDSDVFIHQSLSTPCLNGIQKAEGIWLEDLSGRRYMDFHGNSVHHIGYAHPRLIADLKQQMDTLSFTPRRFTNEVAVELGEKLGDITPGSLAKVLLATGGSDAIEIAIKLARGATGRTKILSFWDSFHGAGLGASSVGGTKTFRSSRMGSEMPGIEHVAPFSCYRCPYGHKDIDGSANFDLCGMSCAEMVRYVLEREGDVAAIIGEPIRALPQFPPKGYWQEIRKACDEFGTMLIFDEIYVGLGKSGRMFACEYDDVTPDILVAGKALGGGIIPVAAIISKRDLDVIPELSVGHYTHEKNPLLCRAALSTIKIIEDEGLLENAQTVGSFALERLHKLKNKYDIIGNVRGSGLLLGIEFVQDRITKNHPGDFAEKVLYAALNCGLSFKVTEGNVIFLNPPLIVTKEQICNAIDILDNCIADVKRLNPQN